MYESLRFMMKMSELKPSGEEKEKKQTYDVTFSKYQGNNTLNISKRKSRLHLKTIDIRMASKLSVMTSRYKKEMEIFYIKKK